MRLKSRPFVHFAPVPGGVYVNGPGGHFALRGPEVLATVVDTALPLLEEGTTLDDIVTALGTDRARPAVEVVARSLADHGMLLDLERLTVDLPDPTTRRRHRETLAMLEARCDDPYAVFERLRGASVVLRGAGDVTVPLARSLHRAGLGRIALVTDDDEVATATCRRLGVALLAPAHAGGLLAGADLVVDVRDAGDGADSAAGIPAATRVTPVVLADRFAAAGPVGSGGQGLGPALANRLGEHARHHGWEESGGPVRAALLGSLAAHLVVEDLAGIGERDAAYVVHGAELEATRLRVPGPELDPGDGPRVAAEEPREVLDRLRAATTDHTGALVLARDDRLPQVHLCLRDVVAVGPQRWSVSWGESQQDATVAAIVDAARSALPPGAGLPVAGVGEDMAVLDGLLQRAAATPLDPVDPPAVDGRCRELSEAVAEAWAEVAGAAPASEVDPSVTVRRVPGTPWHLAEVSSAGHAEPSRHGAGWGRDVGEAVREALSAALARARSIIVHGEDRVRGEAATTSLLRFTAAELRTAREHLSAALLGPDERPRLTRVVDEVAAPAILVAGRLEVVPGEQP